MLCLAIVGTDAFGALFCAADAFFSAEEGPVFFDFTDRVAPVLVLFDSGLGVFTAGTAFLTLSGRTRVCVCQKSLPVRR